MLEIAVEQHIGSNIINVDFRALRLCQPLHRREGNAARA